MMLLRQKTTDLICNKCKGKIIQYTENADLVHGNGKKSTLVCQNCNELFINNINKGNTMIEAENYSIYIKTDDKIDQFLFIIPKIAQQAESSMGVGGDGGGLYIEQHDNIQLDPQYELSILENRIEIFYNDQTYDILLSSIDLLRLSEFDVADISLKLAEHITKDDEENKVLIYKKIVYVYNRLRYNTK